MSASDCYVYVNVSLQRELPVASARFLAAQLHYGRFRSAAVRVGRQPTRSGLPPPDTSDLLIGLLQIHRRDVNPYGVAESVLR